jgi:hypothetical protein
MYNNYRHIVRAEPKATFVAPLSSTDVELATFAAESKTANRKEIASNLLSALPFVVAAALITGFALAVYPVIVHDFPVFLAQSPLG